MNERRVPAGYRVCQCGHNLMQHVLMGPCSAYPCGCMAFNWIEDQAPAALAALEAQPDAR